MPFRRKPRTALVLLTVLSLGVAHGQPSYAIDLGRSASGVLAHQATHVDLLDLPAGISGFTVEVRAAKGGVDLAVSFGDEALRFGVDSEPSPTFAVASPRAGTYRIVVKNRLADDLDYVLTVEVVGLAVLEPGSGVVGPDGSILVRWVGAPGNARAWIGLYAREADDRQFVSRQYLEAAASGERAFAAPSDAGAYEFRMFANDGYDRLAVSAPFDVEVVVAPGTGPIGHGACATDGKCRAP